MSRYVGQYVLHCDLCLQTKTQWHLPFGELQPLPIPEDRWNTISVDFISELPESGGYDAIMVVVDLVGKRGHFSETVTTVTAVGAAVMYRLPSHDKHIPTTVLTTSAMFQALVPCFKH